jgi:hypothetical protein
VKCLAPSVQIGNQETSKRQLNGQSETDATWKRVKLRPIPDEAESEIELLRSDEWIAVTGAADGQVIWLDVPELGIAGPALVESISPAPPIEPGDGHLITGRFRHIAPEILYLYVEGLEKPIGCTPRHPFWSVTRNDYVPAEELEEGEQLRTSTGATAVVQRHELCRKPTPVYNIEVHGVNAYHVSPLGLLVHNASARADDSLIKEMQVGQMGHHVPAVRKSRGRPFEVEPTDRTRPTFHVIGDIAVRAKAHWRMHQAEKPFLGKRQGAFEGTDRELFAAYRRSYRKLTDIRVDVRSPDGNTILGNNVSLVQGVNLIERFLLGTDR